VSIGSKPNPAFERDAYRCPLTLRWALSGESVMKKIILVSIVSLVFQSQYAFSEVIGMKKEDWLKRFKTRSQKGDNRHTPL
jgi:hypothetical protein